MIINLSIPLFTGKLGGNMINSVSDSMMCEINNIAYHASSYRKDVKWE